MMSGLVATLVLGFVGGPSAHDKAVTEMRLSHRQLIVGTWECREDGYVLTWEFSRTGEFTARVRRFDQRETTFADGGGYRVDDQWLEMDFSRVGAATGKVVQLDRRRLTLRWDSNTAVRFRRR
jgi:hypothetical protein